MIYTSLPRKINTTERNVDVKLEKTEKGRDKKSFTDDLLHAVAKKKYEELETIKANLRITKKKCECKHNILLIDKFIIEIESLQGVNH